MNGGAGAGIVRGMTNWMEVADRSIAGHPPSREEARAILGAPDSDVLPLLHAAFTVRERFHGRKVRLHVLENAKSGACPEDCAFCAQSSRYQTGVEKYPLLTVEELLRGAREAKQARAWKYCIVTATRGPAPRDLDVICDAVRQIKQTIDIKVCTSLGILTEESAKRLADAGVDRFNHNLETSERLYPSIVGSHTYQDRVRTCQLAKDAGMDICSGGIVGLGEEREDVIDLCFALRDLDADSIPVNFLNPRPGTPLGERGNGLTPHYCLKVLALFRFVHPRKDLRVAGGREVNLRSLQPLALYAVNSIFTDGYLTTDGAKPSADHQMILDMGFEIEEVPEGTAPRRAASELVTAGGRMRPNLDAGGA